MADENRETPDATPPDPVTRVAQALQDVATAQNSPKSGFGPRERSSTLNDTVLAEALRQMNQAEHEAKHEKRE